VLGSELGLK